MKSVTITIRFSDNRDKVSLKITGGIFRKVGLYVDGKFTKFYSLTKIIQRINKILINYFKEQ